MRAAARAGLKNDVDPRTRLWYLSMGRERSSSSIHKPGPCDHHAGFLNIDDR